MNSLIIMIPKSTEFQYKNGFPKVKQIQQHYNYR